MSCSISAYFGGKFVWEALIYSSLTGKTPAKVLQWAIEEAGSRYAIWAVYEYRFKEKTFMHKARLPGPLFLNEGAAVTEMKAKSKEILTAYYDPESPARSALGRTFPTNYGIRFAISLLVLIYFLIFNKRLKLIFNQ